MTGLKQNLESTEKSSMVRKVTIGLIIFSAFIGIIGGFIYWAISDLPNILLEV